MENRQYRVFTSSHYVHYRTYLVEAKTQDEAIEKVAHGEVEADEIWEDYIGEEEYNVKEER